MKGNKALAEWVLLPLIFISNFIKLILIWVNLMFAKNVFFLHCMLGHAFFWGKLEYDVGMKQ